MKIDETFMDVVRYDGQTTIKGILIFTVVCCSIILMISLAFLPYLFKVDKMYFKTIEFTLYMSRTLS
jgi:hypothetical protein